MTVNVENTAQTPLFQEKVDTNLSQQKVDTNLSQQNQDQQQTQDDPNWKAFREARKKDRADREAAERRATEKEAEANALKAAMEAAFSKSNNQSNQNSDYAEEETQDQIIDKKVQAALAQRDESYRREQQQREQQEYPQRLVKNYPDFNQMISQENLDYLDYHFPEVSRPLQRLHDGFDKWSDIYLAVKKFVPNNMNSKKDSIKADANFAKPKSISTTGITQPQAVSSSARLTKEKKAENWARMRKTINNLS